MVAAGLIRQEPRRGLRVSMIQLADHMDLIQTRRALEHLIAANAARRATAQAQPDRGMRGCQMIRASEGGNLDDYMHADQLLDHVCHQACRNESAVNAVEPLIIQCRRFWYAYQHEGDIAEGAPPHVDGPRHRHRQRSRRHQGRRFVDGLPGDVHAQGDQRVI